jgi:hypothetical protein
MDSVNDLKSLLLKVRASFLDRVVGKPGRNESTVGRKLCLSSSSVRSSVKWRLHCKSYSPNHAPTRLERVTYSSVEISGSLSCAVRIDS